jgi:hypothetical protein
VTRKTKTKTNLNSKQRSKFAALLLVHVMMTTARQLTKSSGGYKQTNKQTKKHKSYRKYKSENTTNTDLCDVSERRSGA